MHQRPREPSDYPAQADPTGLKDCEPRSDNGHISFIEVAEWLGGGLTKQDLSDAVTCIVALLNRHLGDAWQWLSVLLERSCISDYVYVWMSGNREIVLYANAAGAVSLHLQPFARWRWSHSRSPDDGLACDAFPANDYSVRVDLINAVPQPHFYPKLLQPAFGCLGEFRGKIAQNARRHVNQHDAGRGGIDTAKLGFQRAAKKQRKRSGEFDTGWTSPNQDKGQEILVSARIFFRFCLLKRLQHLIADTNRVRQSFQAGRKLCKFIVAKVTVRDSRCDNQDVVVDGNTLPVLIAGVDTFCVLIDSSNFSKDYGRISLILQKRSDR
jgi:hypothetical protein